MKYFLSFSCLLLLLSPLLFVWLPSSPSYWTDYQDLANQHRVTVAVKELEQKQLSLAKFFHHYNCPTVNYQLISDYIAAADKYKIDYRLLPAISVEESSCARFYPRNTNNIWGWASGRTGFKDLQSGVSFITEQLAENHHYANKTITQKLHAYNPNVEYASKIIGLMKDIKQ